MFPTFSAAGQKPPVRIGNLRRQSRRSSSSSSYGSEMKAIYLLSVGLIYLLVSEVASLEEPNTTLVPVENYKTNPYCFRFTWLGPKYNKDTPYKNLSCENVLKKAKGIPCFHPLVITNNTNIPDTDYMWEEYKDKPSQIACRLVRGEICARFSYRYNGAIENITYMCAKLNVDNESSTTSNCYKEDRHGREIEVCVCESAAGRTPCNRSAMMLADSAPIVPMALALAVIQLVLLKCLQLR
ncbi:hypothetical protein AND_008593 [Anopheles darlingi]|uniref:Uncharacterized protein n=1 Tax=Anopheles darlingi TaxID=43151 RepID=W5JAI7_ANODA|nr:uncharacterized protein LOC125958290 [Anopheles darlingi]ETN59799.1 hypothetical protein AND_008593 [Anopheles darlingi]